MDNNKNSEDKNGGKVSTPSAGAPPESETKVKGTPIMVVVLCTVVLLVLGFIVVGGDKDKKLETKITVAMDVINEETGNKEAGDFPYADVIDNVGIPAPSH